MPSLRPYQEDGVRFLASTDVAFICDEMGLGKTVMGVMDLRDNEATVIVAPSGLLGVWRRHIEVWRPDIRPRVCKTVAEIRAPVFGEAVILSPDALGWAKGAASKRGVRDMSEIAAARLGALRSGMFSAGHRLRVILDEAHRLKGGDARRAQVVGEILRVCAYQGAKRRALTATPMPRDPMDIWCLAHRMGADRHPHAWGGRGFAGFASWARASSAGRDRWDFAGPPLLPLDHPDVMGRLLLRRLVKDHLPEIPDPTHSIRIVSLPGDARSLADEILKAACRAVGADHRRIDAATVDAPAEDVDEALLKTITRMDRGSISSLSAELAAAKVAAVLAEVDRLVAEDQPTIVYSEHRAIIDAMAPRFPVVVGEMSQKKRDAAVAKFQEGDALAFGFTAAGREGITLTRASTMINADCGWILDELDQAIGRGRRFGSVGPLHIMHFLADHPLERLRVRCLRRRRAFKMAALGSSI